MLRQAELDGGIGQTDSFNCWTQSAVRPKRPVCLLTNHSERFQNNHQ